MAFSLPAVKELAEGALGNDRKPRVPESGNLVSMDKLCRKLTSSRQFVSFVHRKKNTIS